MAAIDDRIASALKRVYLRWARGNAGTRNLFARQAVLVRRLQGLARGREAP